MRKTRGFALGLLLVAALTGCGGQDGNNVASAGGAATSTNSSEHLSDHEKAVKYAQCLRDQGIEVADPEGDRPPGIERGVASDQEVEAAEQACRQYLPEGPKTRKLDQEQLEKLREVAQCMRAHGFPNFPDPDPDKGGISLGDDSGIDTKDPMFKAAQQECGMGGTPVGDGEMQGGR
jgi:hypothetical protein